MARSAGEGATSLVPEAATALAGLGPDPAGLVTACRRLVERHPGLGPMWWLASRVLCAADPMDEAWNVASAIQADATAALLAATLPDDATVVLLGWPEVAVEGVRRRGDVRVLVVSGGGESAGLVRRLCSAGTEAEDVPDAGLAAAVASADVVLLEALAAGPERFLAVAGSHAAAAVGHATEVPVWLVTGVGRLLPTPLWEALEARLDRSAAPPWHRGHDVVPRHLCDRGIGPVGHDDVCPVAPELLKPPA